MSGTVHIAAPADAVWSALNDPGILRAAIPGCRSFERTGVNEFRGAANVAVGPVRSVFSGTLRLSEVNLLHSYRVAGEGASPHSGSAAGTALITLTPNGQGTDIHYEVEAAVGGKIAMIGQRFIDQAAKKMAEDFFLRFSALTEGKATKSA
ncbi:MAG: carbon monoxide dehydrogenase subunit G [Alphaproteobacteria bacterium]